MRRNLLLNSERLTCSFRGGPSLIEYCRNSEPPPLRLALRWLINRPYTNSSFVSFVSWSTKSVMLVCTNSWYKYQDQKKRTLSLKLFMADKYFTWIVRVWTATVLVVPKIHKYTCPVMLIFYQNFNSFLILFLPLLCLLPSSK